MLKAVHACPERYRGEAESSDWRDGFAAYGLQIGLDMGKGHQWALGWLTARLLDTDGHK